jgi:hypothetical protein
VSAPKKKNFRENFTDEIILSVFSTTEVEMKLYPSVKITDEKILSLIPLVFADFLVMMHVSENFLQLHMLAKLWSLRILTFHRIFRFPMYCNNGQCHLL